MTSGNWTQSSGENGHEQQTTGRKRKRKSRWATGEDEKVILPTVIPAGLSRDQEEQYIGVYRKALLIYLHQQHSNTQSKIITNWFFLKCSLLQVGCWKIRSEYVTCLQFYLLQHSC